MKKKLLQEQKEKAIIESFAKNFNKIKRLDENYMDEALDVTQHLKVGDRLEKINTATPDTLTIVKIEGNKLFIKPDSADQVFQWTLDSVDDEIKRGKLKWIPKNEEIDEISIPKILAPIAFAAGMAGAPKASQAQMQQPQGIEKSVTDTSAVGLPEDTYKAGKMIYNSYMKNPFTADMWSKRSRENMRFFKAVKKLADYRATGGQIDNSDLEQLGEMAIQSSVATDFLQRKKDDATTARLEENVNIHDKYTPLQQIHNAFNKLEKNDFHGWFNTYRNDLLKKEKNLIAVTYNQAFSNGAYDAKGDPSRYEDGEDYYNKNFGQ